MIAAIIAIKTSNPPAIKIAICTLKIVANSTLTIIPIKLPKELTEPLLGKPDLALYFPTRLQSMLVQPH